MTQHVILTRQHFGPQTTIGRLWFNAVPLAYTLEDTLRPAGIKVPGHTCIPDGVYKAAVSRSQRFARDMVMLSNCENGYEIQANGISFTGIRVHGGNTHEHTEGCILAARSIIDHADGNHAIQGSQESKVTELVRRITEEDNDTCEFIITSLLQS
jgi:hypothetical protein